MDSIDSSAERKKFEAVWKRVTERTHDPYAIPAYLSTDTAAQPSYKDTENTVNASAYGHTGPAGRIGSGENYSDAEEVKPLCDALLLKRFITEETHIANRYHALSVRCTRRDISILFFRLYSESRSILRKLQAGLFILTGDLLKLQPIKPPNCSFMQILLDLYRTQSDAVTALEDASNSAALKKVSLLFLSVAAYKRKHITVLESVIERVI